MAILRHGLFKGALFSGALFDGGLFNEQASDVPIRYPSTIGAGMRLPKSYRLRHINPVKQQYEAEVINKYDEEEDIVMLLMIELIALGVIT